MPYVKKTDYERNKRILGNLNSEFRRHDDFIEKYKNTLASRCTNSNFAEIKQKRDLLQSIIINRTNGD